MLYQRPKSRFTCASTSGLIASCLIYFLLGTSTAESMGWYLSVQRQQHFQSKQLLLVWPLCILSALVAAKQVYPLLSQRCRCCFRSLRALICFVVFVDVVIAHAGLFVLVSLKQATKPSKEHPVQTSDVRRSTDGTIRLKYVDLSMTKSA